jgi:hypothetical protein
LIIITKAAGTLIENFSVKGERNSPEAEITQQPKEIQ